MHVGIDTGGGTGRSVARLRHGIPEGDDACKKSDDEGHVPQGTAPEKSAASMQANDVDAAQAKMFLPRSFRGDFHRGSRWETSRWGKDDGPYCGLSLRRSTEAVDTVSKAVPLVA